MKVQSSKFKVQSLLVIFFLMVLLLPLVALAGEYQADGTTVRFEGLVPCGKSQPSANESPEVTMPCQLCHFLVMLDAILDFVIAMAFIIAVLMIVFAGLIYIVGAVFPENIAPVTLSKAHSIMTAVGLGLLVIFGAWIIVNTIFVFLGAADWVLEFTGPGKWSQIICPIEL